MSSPPQALPKTPSAPPKASNPELDGLNKTIRERRVYYRQQEVLIAESADAGNAILQGLEYEIMTAKSVLKSLKIDIRTCRQDYRLAREDLHIIQVQIIEATDKIVEGGLPNGIPEGALG